MNQTLRRNICLSADGPLNYSGEYLDELVLDSDNSADNVKTFLPYNTALMSQECMACDMYAYYYKTDATIQRIKFLK